MRWWARSGAACPATEVNRYSSHTDGDASVDIEVSVDARMCVVAGDDLETASQRFTMWKMIGKHQDVERDFAWRVIKQGGKVVDQLQLTR